MVTRLQGASHLMQPQLRKCVHTRFRVLAGLQHRRMAQSHPVHTGIDAVAGEVLKRSHQQKLKWKALAMRAFVRWKPRTPLDLMLRA